MRRRNLELTLLLAAATVVSVAALTFRPHTEMLTGVAQARVIVRGTESIRPYLEGRIADDRIDAVAGALAQAAALESDTWRQSASVHHLLARARSMGISQAERDSAAPLIAVRTDASARKRFCWTFGALIAGFLLLHLAFRLASFSGSQVVLPVLFTLTATATLVLTTFTDSTRDVPLEHAFVTGALGGCLVLWIMARMVSMSALNSFKYLILVTALTMTVLLILFGNGPAGTDAKINLFGLFQPAEFVKLLVAIFLAGWFASHDVELQRLDSVRFGILSLPRRRDIAPMLVAMLFVLALFFLQRDLGPALVLGLLFLVLFVAASRRLILSAAALGVLGTVFWITYRAHLLQTVTTRIEMWLSPWENYRHGGVQMAESYWALAAGQWLGRRYAATPSMIPAGHTDLILAATGEVGGWVLVLMALTLLLALVLVAIGQIKRTRNSFSCYLALALGMLWMIQTLIISGATVGLLPLTGIPVPFLSYGKSATLAQFAAAGILLGLSGERQPLAASRPRLANTSRIAAFAICVGMACVCLRAAQCMLWKADDTLARAATVTQADGVRRFQYNRRLTRLALALPRGAIIDRSGFALATDRREEIDKARVRAAKWGLRTDEWDGRSRYYPLGPTAVHILGHTRSFWTDPRTVEKSEDGQLRGYPMGERLVRVDGERIALRDYTPLVKPFRDGAAYRGLLAGDRNVTVTMDARMQAAAYLALSANLPTIHGQQRTHAAAVVLDACSGAIRALVSLPSYDPNEIQEEQRDLIYGPVKAGLDRARFEVYPPGSTFKVVTASAALEAGQSAELVRCRHTASITHQFHGESHRRRVTDDAKESPHGECDMRKAIVDSCNVYFATIGVRLGTAALYNMANGFRLDLKAHSAADLEPNLPDNAYGQGVVTASPIRMAAVAAAIANGGESVEPYYLDSRRTANLRVLSPENAASLRDWMVEAVRAGTGRAAAVPHLLVGGKTGTAQNRSGDSVSHSWFIGFARLPGERGETLAFAFIVENGGYGGGAGAHAAHDFLVRVLSGN